MSRHPLGSAYEEEYRSLRVGLLRASAIVAGGVSYVWLFFAVWPFTGGGQVSPLAWAGVLALLTSSAVAFRQADKRLHQASYVLVAGLLVSSLSATLAYAVFDLGYLLIIPVYVASFQLSRREAVWVGLGVLICALGLVAFWGYGLVPGNRLAIYLSIILVGLLTSWFAVGSLQKALAWVGDAYDQAIANQLEARDSRGKLRRALKALDEAAHRLERTNYMLAIARHRADDARRLKQQFAQNISHELRTPLNLIIGFTELMTDSPEYYGDSSLPQNYRRDLSIIHRNAMHLRRLVDDVLDLARIEMAKMPVFPEPVSPAALIGDAVATAGGLVEGRGLELRLAIAQDLPELWADPTRIRQVLVNLLNNAGRFTESGWIEVGAMLQDDEVIFHVRDTGVGIAEDQRVGIFEEFRQVDGSTRRQHGGAGLGLAISREFVNMHGGRIWVESRIGEGSTFYFALPVGGPHGSGLLGHAIGDTSPEITPIGGQEPVVLAVTRSPSAVGILNRYVAGCRTAVVTDLKQARTTVKQIVPQAIVVDSALADSDDVPIADLLVMPELRDSTIVVCPLPGEDPVRRQMGVDGYLSKPISPETLADTLRGYGPDIESVLVVDDDHDFVMLVERMLNSLPRRSYSTVAAHTGHEALSLATELHPDLILLDLRLPDMDGIEVASKLRVTSGLVDVPIVIISAQGDLDHWDSLAGEVRIMRQGGLTPTDIVSWIRASLATSEPD